MDDYKVNQLNTFRERFVKMTNKEIIDVLEREAKTPGWTTSKSLFLSALRGELEKRKIDKVIR